MVFTRKAVLMALTGAALIGYLGYGEWSERSAEATAAANLEAYRHSLRDVEVPENLRQLPDLRGQGYVRDLLQAAVIDQHLQNLLQQYVAEPNMSRRAELVKPILVAWVKTSKRSPSINQVLEQVKSSQPLYLQASGEEDEKAGELLDKVYALEVVTGSQFFTYQGFSEDAEAGRAVVTLRSGAVPREIDVRLQEGVYTLQLRDLNLRPQQTIYVENAYRALVGSLDRSLLKGRYRYCLEHPLPGFEDMNYQKLCRMELVLGRKAMEKVATAADSKKEG